MNSLTKRKILYNLSDSEAILEHCAWHVKWIKKKLMNLAEASISRVYPSSKHKDGFWDVKKILLSVHFWDAFKTPITYKRRQKDISYLQDFTARTFLRRLLDTRPWRTKDVKKTSFEGLQLLKNIRHVFEDM